QRRFQMRHRILASVALMAAVSVSGAAQSTKAPAAATKAPAAKAYNPPKTPWGDPDLQGTWTSDDYIGTPLQRQASFGDRLYLTEKKIPDKQNDIKNPAQRSLQESPPKMGPVSLNPPGHWGERARRPPTKTSFVVAPPNGQIPAILPEARARRQG